MVHCILSITQLTCTCTSANYPPVGNNFQHLWQGTIEIHMPYTVIEERLEQGHLKPMNTGVQSILNEVKVVMEVHWDSAAMENYWWL